MRKGELSMINQITVTFDGGTSLTKIIYRVIRNGKLEGIKHLTNSPEIIKLIERPKQEGIIGNIGGWIQLPPKKENEYYAIGKMAKKKGATSSVKKLKYEGFIPKILAAIGEIAVKENLGENFGLNLYSLLPYSEFENRQELEKALRIKLKLFWFAGKRIKPELKLYRCYPEGLGVALEAKRKLGVEQWKAKRIGILIFGYKNLSWLLFEDGIFCHEESYSNEEGFAKLLNSAADLLPGISKEEIQDAIVTEKQEYVNRKKLARETKLITKVKTLRLIKDTSKSGKIESEKRIQKALTSSLLQYWELILNFLYEVGASSVDTIYYAGGSGIFVEEKLREYSVEEKVEIQSVSQLENLVSEMGKLPALTEVLGLKEYQLEKFISQNLELRAEDCWNLFANMTKYFEEISQQELATQSA